jgi:hypothetical protein
MVTGMWRYRMKVFGTTRYRISRGPMPIYFLPPNHHWPHAAAMLSSVMPRGVTGPLGTKSRRMTELLHLPSSEPQPSA